jgi:hypothetical protein
MRVQCTRLVARDDLLSARSPARIVLSDASLFPHLPPHSRISAIAGSLTNILRWNRSPHSAGVTSRYPKPPDLRAAETQNKSDGELHYTIENGVRLSGMPAFHGTHTVPQTWRLVLFIRHLPQITPEELNEMKGWDPKNEADPAHF